MYMCVLVMVRAVKELVSRVVHKAKGIGYMSTHWVFLKYFHRGFLGSIQIGCLWCFLVERTIHRNIQHFVGSPDITHDNITILNQIWHDLNGFFTILP